jgi:type I restriction enzyme S subunit
LNQEFLRHLICNPAFTAYIKAVQTGTSIPHISGRQIGDYHLLVPPLSEQRAIAHVLDSLDDKIGLNRRMNETLEGIARALFKSWFVDFDPVRAKFQTNGGEVAEHLAISFPPSFEQSDVGVIPKGWSCRPLRAWVDALSGGTPSKDRTDLWNGDIPWISPKVMTALHADEAENYVSERAIGNGTRLAPAGSTLIMVRGMGLHQEVRVSQAKRDVAFNQDVKALVPRAIEPSLLLFALLHAQDDLLGRVESSGHGTGRLPSDVLLAHPITMPERQVQEQLARVFDDLNARIASAREESRTLVALRDAMLPKLLSGEVRIPFREEIASVIS